MRKGRLGRVIVAVAGAGIALGFGYHYGGDIHSPKALTGAAAAQLTRDRIITYSAGFAFFVLGFAACRWLADELARVVAQADKASASVLKMVLTIAGIIVVLLVTLAMLRIGVSQLLLGGAITGVVLGIAAQQSLGNFFAGIVLMVARPFRAGDHIRVRTGSLGGPFEGDVVSMGLTYVTFSTEEGLTYVPNLTLLSSGVVRSPRPLPGAEPSTPPAPPASTASPGTGAGRVSTGAPDED